VPLISEVSRDEIATPAASSDAELILWPVDRRAIDVSISLFTLLAAACAISAPVFVATLNAILNSYFLYFNEHLELG
jgi:hypothetical protein